MTVLICHDQRSLITVMLMVSYHKAQNMPIKWCKSRTASVSDFYNKMCYELN